MKAELKATTKTHTEYDLVVELESGKRMNMQALVVEGYSTERDIPKMLAIRYPNAVLISATKGASKQVRSFR